MYALVDGNSFYCSCERVFRADLEGKPVVVLSNNDGCVIALTDEAKAAGIRMGTPIHMIPGLIKRHDVQVFSSNYTLYGDMSRRMMGIFSRFVPAMEVYSIDEAFLDMSSLYNQDLLKLGMIVRSSVKKLIGIPTCVGIAPTKTLAKLANRFAKKFRKHLGVHWLANQQLTNEALEKTPVEDIWGVGRQHAQRLHAAGFHTALDFSRAPADWVRREMSVVMERTLNELRGVACIAWDYEPPVQQNVSCSRSFGNLQTELTVLENALATYTGVCAAKLREQHLCASRMQVFIQTNPFRIRDKQYYRSIELVLPRQTNDTGILISHAVGGLQKIFAKGYNYLKTGIVLSDLVPEGQVQTGLFDNADHTRRARLMQVLDAINMDQGRQVVHYASQGDMDVFKLRANYKSGRYTTRWEELCTITG